MDIYDSTNIINKQERAQVLAVGQKQKRLDGSSKMIQETNRNLMSVSSQTSLSNHADALPLRGMKNLLDQ